MQQCERQEAGGDRGKVPSACDRAGAPRRLQVLWTFAQVGCTPES
jgi:hypothetical protein